MANLTRRLRRGGRNYAAAVLINLVLINTVLTPPARSGGAQTRIVTAARRFRETELVTLPGGEVGVLSIPYTAGTARTTIEAN